MAIAGSPTFNLEESPTVAIEIFSNVSLLILFNGTATTATSRLASVPFTTPSTLSLSINETVRLVLFSITWLFVTLNNSASFLPMIIPEPLLWLSCICVPPKKLCTSCTLMFVINTNRRHCLFHDFRNVL